MSDKPKAAIVALDPNAEVAHALGCALAVVSKGTSLGLTLQQVHELGEVAYQHGVNVATAIAICDKLAEHFCLTEAQQHTEDILDITRGTKVSRISCIRLLVESCGDVDLLHARVEDATIDLEEKRRTHGVSLAEPMSERQMDRRLGLGVQKSRPRRVDKGATPKDLFDTLLEKAERFRQLRDD